jgi:hypothetical protein
MRHANSHMRRVRSQYEWYTPVTASGFRAGKYRPSCRNCSSGRSTDHFCVGRTLERCSCMCSLMGLQAPSDPVRERRGWSSISEPQSICRRTRDGTADAVPRASATTTSSAHCVREVDCRTVRPRYDRTECVACLIGRSDPRGRMRRVHDWMNCRPMHSRFFTGFA